MPALVWMQGNAKIYAASVCDCRPVLELRLEAKSTMRAIPLVFIFCAALLLSPEARAAGLDQAIRDYAASHGFSGSVLVRREGRTLFREGFGLADRSFSVPARADTTYRIASITKLFAAALVLQLRDVGRVDLRAAVATYLPDYARNGAERVPVLNFLNHTSGLANMDRVKSYEDAVANGVPPYQTPMTSQQLLERFASGPLVRKTGEAFDYNNADYIVIGKVIEAVTRKPFEQALGERILKPLAMRNSGMVKQSQIIPNIANTYFRPNDKAPFVNDLPLYGENWYAAGAMYSTADDLATFAEALFGGRLVKAASLRALMTPGLGKYGLGLWVRTIKLGGRTYTTGERYGSIMGANGLLFAVPDLRLTIIILGNTNAADMGDFVDHIAPAALGG
jgi:D-alanyl-D-alanine carboxypeptidase